MSTREKLLADIEAFLAECADMSPTAFGLRSTGDKNLLRRLNNGADINTGTHDDVRRFMDRIRRERGAQATRAAA